mgnify:CR=1 FL=1
MVASSVAFLIHMTRSLESTCSFFTYCLPLRSLALALV